MPLALHHSSQLKQRAARIGFCGHASSRAPHSGAQRRGALGVGQSKPSTVFVFAVWSKSKMARVSTYLNFPRSTEEAFLFYRSRSEEHTSELQSPKELVCRVLLEKKNRKPVQRFVLKAEDEAEGGEGLVQPN